MSDRKYWTDKYNSLDMEIRTIGKAASCLDKITSLGSEKSRLERAYKSAIRGINETIKHCESELIKMTRKDKA